MICTTFFGVRLDGSVFSVDLLENPLQLLGMQIPRVGLLDQSSPAGAQTDPFLRTLAKEAEEAPYSLGNRPRVMAFRDDASGHLSQNLLRFAHRRTENRRAAGQVFYRHQPEAFQFCRRQEHQIGRLIVPREILFGDEAEKSNPPGQVETPDQALKPRSQRPLPSNEYQDVTQLLPLLVQCVEQILQAHAGSQVPNREKNHAIRG